jgi:hypothetical protein
MQFLKTWTSIARRIHPEAAHELRLRAAVHEAGHTVVGVRAGFHFTRRRNVLRADADGYGHCLMSHHHRASARSRLLQLMAGRVAEGRWLNCYEPEIHREIRDEVEIPDGIGSLSDQKFELGIALQKNGNGGLDCMFAGLAQCRLLADRIVADKGVWADIQRLAAELYSAGRLSAADVEAILRQGHQRRVEHLPALCIAFRPPECSNVSPGSLLPLPLRCDGLDLSRHRRNEKSAREPSRTTGIDLSASGETMSPAGEGRSRARVRRT